MLSLLGMVVPESQLPGGRAVAASMVTENLVAEGLVISGPGVGHRCLPSDGAAGAGRTLAVLGSGLAQCYPAEFIVGWRLQGPGFRL